MSPYFTNTWGKQNTNFQIKVSNTITPNYMYFLLTKYSLGLLIFILMKANKVGGGSTLNSHITKNKLYIYSCYLFLAFGKIRKKHSEQILLFCFVDFWIWSQYDSGPTITNYIEQSTTYLDNHVKQSSTYLGRTTIENSSRFVERSPGLLSWSTHKKQL